MKGNIASSKIHKTVFAKFSKLSSKLVDGATLKESNRVKEKAKFLMYKNKLYSNKERKREMHLDSVTPG